MNAQTAFLVLRLLATICLAAGAWMLAGLGWALVVIGFELLVVAHLVMRGAPDVE